MSRKTVDVELRLPMQTTTRLSELAQLSGTSIGHVVKVLLAIEVLRARPYLKTEKPNE